LADESGTSQSFLAITFKLKELQALSRKGCKNKNLKTHCKQGHPLNPDTIYIARWRGREQRVCKTCHAKCTAAVEKTDTAKALRKSYYAETKNAFWRRYSHLKATAKKFGKELTLTIEDYINWVKENACSYCGGKLPIVGYGIDRLNNKEGYTQFNVVACCERCNEKKGSLEGIGFVFPRTVDLLLEMLRVA
jgi:hypothetical protein